MTQPLLIGMDPGAPRDNELLQTWAVHRALIIAESGDETLKQNPRWQLLRMDAYEAFHDAITRYCHGC